MFGHAKNLYEMYRFGKSAVNSKVFEKSLNKAKKNYQQKRKKQEKRLKRTKAGRKQLKEMKARQKATKQLWDGVTKMIQPLGKVLTSARKLANNLTKAELVKSVKKDMKKKVIQKQNCTLPVYVQADKRMVASVSLQESVDAFTIFLRKYPTAKEAKAALPTMSKYKGTYVYKQVEEAIRNGRYKGLVHFEEFMRVNGGHDPLFPRRGSVLTKNQTSNQLNINSSGNKSNSSSTKKTFGSNGVKVTSKTVWKAKGSKARIDVENPNPGQRPGQVHYQDENNVKYYFDPERGIFYDQKTGNIAPKKVMNMLKDKEFVKKLNVALTQYLGEKPFKP